MEMISWFLLTEQGMTCYLLHAKFGRYLLLFARLGKDLEMVRYKFTEKIPQRKMGEEKSEDPKRTLKIKKNNPKPMRF